MKIPLPKYHDLDFDRNVWKTLSAIKSIQIAYNKTKVSKNLLSFILMLDTDRPFDKTKPLTSEKIKTFYEIISNNLELLLKNNLIENSNEIGIPSEHDEISSYLTNQLYLNIPLPLNSFEFYERLIPHSNSTKGVYTNDDDSFTSLSRGMYVTRGLFIKTWIDDIVFSGIIEMGSNSDEIYHYLLDIQNDLKNVGIVITVLESIPIRPIPLFPLFTEASDLKYVIEKQAKEESKLPIEDIMRFFQTWYRDYIESYREIAGQVSRIELADPYWNKPKHYVIIINDKHNTILSAQYLSEHDGVDVRIMENVPMMEKLHDEVKDLPNKENLLRTSVSWSNDILNSYRKPPFYSALETAAQTINEFNKKGRCPIFDANDVTDEEIKNWINASIAAKRYLIKKLKIRDTGTLRWLSPISITAEYSLDEPRQNWRRSGHLFCRYSISDSDKTIVHKLEKTDYKEKKLSALNEKSEKEIMWSSGDLLHRMMEIRGEHASVNF